MGLLHPQLSPLKLVRNRNLPLNLRIPLYFVVMTPRLLQRYSKLSFFGSYMYVILPILFWNLSMYPAILTPDSYMLLRAIRSEGGYFDPAYINPVHYLFVKTLSFDGNLLIVVTLVQSVLVFIAIYVWTRTLTPLIYRRFSLMISGVLFISPFFGPFAVSIWKDVPFVSLVMIGLAFMSRKDLNFKTAVLGILLMALGASFRYEGVLVLAMCGLLMFFVSLIFRDKAGDRFGMKRSFLFIFSCIISMLFLFSARYVSGIDSPSKFYSVQSLFLDLEYVRSNYPSTLDEKTVEKLSRVTQTPTLVGKDSCFDNTPFFTSNFDIGEATLLSGTLPRLWVEALFSDARESLVTSRFCRNTAFLPFPISSTPKSGYWPTIGHGPDELKPERPIVIETLLYPIGWAWTRLWILNGNLIGWPGLHFTIVLVLALLYRSKTYLKIIKPSDCVLTIPLIFLVSRTLVLFGTVATQEFRYFSHVYFLSLPMIAAVTLHLFAAKKL